MTAHKRYFRLRDSVGVEPEASVEHVDADGNVREKANKLAGELQPLTNVGVRVTVPVGVNGTEILVENRSAEITPDGLYETLADGKRIGLPHTDDRIVDVEGRVLALTTPAVIDAIVWSENYDEVDRPKSTPKKEQKNG